MRFEIIETVVRGGGPTIGTWTVMAYDDDGTLRGGDAHWLTLRAAQVALDVYEVRPELHGSTERTILRAAGRVSFF